MRFFVFLTIFAVHATGGAAACLAQQPDPDFAYQGEYVGTLYVPGSGNQTVGLQVVALGGGKFKGTRYRDGLPGTGWDRQTKSPLSGQLDSGRLVLTGEGITWLLANRTAVALDDAGRELGRLTQIQRISPTMGLRPPPGATVLFDGTASEQLVEPKLTPDGLLQAGVQTKLPVDAFRLHLEFRTPYMPQARGQARGNSGVYIQQRYEVQILDSFGLEGIENECGSLYRQQRPDLNMCLPPLAWQTYDIWFTPPQFAADGKTKVANARITVLHNGVPIHLHREIIAKTGGGKAEAPSRLPIVLQDHGNPVVFRNLWLIPGLGDAAYGWTPRASTVSSSDGFCRGRRLRWRAHRCR
ncbi:MAG: DUF1080 domain-containing protein [Pirellulaceae bacterium]